MKRLGLSVSVAGLALSVASTLLLLTHVTDQYHSHIQDIGSIAVGYLGAIVCGLSLSVTGVALLLWGRGD
ncbi:hypothetical protein ACOZ35_07845 [Halorubrum xinjiangense]|uniref:hypothetical protein n=1 Tax=Halorubrum xinjiangense TaxID=261291 RepID=UPI003C6F83E8